MQATFSRQNHAQNLLSLAIFMLIICYYAFNGIPQDTLGKNDFSLENSPEQNKTVAFEKSVSRLRAAILMDADAVQINGLLYEVENASEGFINRKKAKVAVQKIYNRLLLGDKQKAIQLINELTLILLK